jgi:predicted short-subunit dehydrogenase-like oxidoreductase (DUF2520 family)
MRQIKSVCILGAGNVATHFGKSIKNAGIKVSQIYNRSEEAGIELAGKLGCNYISDLKKINETADIILFAISDSAIVPILKSRSWENKFLVHTSGSIPSEIFYNYTNKFGAIYPLQTFSKEKEIDFSAIPLFIIGNTPDNSAVLKSFSDKLSKSVSETDSDKKAILHLAAVFANNFSNHMFSIADELLKKNDLSFELLFPLIEETALKALKMKPRKAQTGPAIRNNIEVLKKQTEMLATEPEWQKIYTFVSESIQKYYNSRDDKF